MGLEQGQQPMPVESAPSGAPEISPAEISAAVNIALQKGQALHQEAVLGQNRIAQREDDLAQEIQAQRQERLAAIDSHIQEVVTSSFTQAQSLHEEVKPQVLSDISEQARNEAETKIAKEVEKLQQEVAKASTEEATSGQPIDELQQLPTFIRAHESFLADKLDFNRITLSRIANNKMSDAYGDYSVRTALLAVKRAIEESTNHSTIPSKDVKQLQELMAHDGERIFGEILQKVQLPQLSGEEISIFDPEFSDAYVMRALAGKVEKIVKHELQPGEIEGIKRFAAKILSASPYYTYASEVLGLEHVAILDPRNTAYAAVKALETLRQESNRQYKEEPMPEELRQREAEIAQAKADQQTFLAEHQIPASEVAELAKFADEVFKEDGTYYVEPYTTILQSLFPTHKIDGKVSVDPQRDEYAPVYALRVAKETIVADDNRQRAENAANLAEFPISGLDAMDLLQYAKHHRTIAKALLESNDYLQQMYKQVFYGKKTNVKEVLHTIERKLLKRDSTINAISASEHPGLYIFLVGLIQAKIHMDTARENGLDKRWNPIVSRNLRTRFAASGGVKAQKAFRLPRLAEMLFLDM